MTKNNLQSANKNSWLYEYLTNEAKVNQIKEIKQEVATQRLREINTKLDDIEDNVNGKVTKD